VADATFSFQGFCTNPVAAFPTTPVTSVAVGGRWWYRFDITTTDTAWRGNFTFTVLEATLGGVDTLYFSEDNGASWSTLTGFGTLGQGTVNPLNATILGATYVVVFSGVTASTDASAEFTLTLTGNVGYPSTSFTDTIQVGGSPPANVAPVAAASVTPTSGTAPLIVSYNGSGSSDSDGTIASYSWDFGDSSPSSSSASGTHTFTAAGTYTVTLTVTDDDGATGTASVVVTVSAPPVNVAPAADAYVTPTSGTAPLTVSYSGSGSTDADGTIVSYSWNFGDGSPTSSSVSGTHTFTSAGTYTVTLTVTDDDGATGVDTAVVTVSTPGGVDCVAAGSITLDPACVPGFIGFSGGESLPLLSLDGVVYEQAGGGCSGTPLPGLPSGGWSTVAVADRPEWGNYFFGWLNERASYMPFAGDCLLARVPLRSGATLLGEVGVRMDRNTTGETWLTYRPPGGTWQEWRAAILPDCVTSVMVIELYPCDPGDPGTGTGDWIIGRMIAS
jgi:PKD repeat protein